MHHFTLKLDYEMFQKLPEIALNRHENDLSTNSFFLHLKFLSDNKIGSNKEEVPILKQILHHLFLETNDVTRSADAIHETPVLTRHTVRDKTFESCVYPSRDSIMKWFKNFLK